jgi:glycosyltransferase involved in cell wall biosynthesis
MKILYICDIDLKEEGAAKVHIFEIIKNLKKYGEEVTLFAPNFKKRIKNKQESFIHFLPFINKLGFQALSYNLILFFNLIYWILFKKIQAIYIRQSGTLIAPALISKIFSIPLISEINGTIEKQLLFENYPKIFIILNNIVEKISYSVAQRIITPSIELKNYISLKYHIKKKKIIFLENGVNTEFFNKKNKMEVREKLRLNQNTFYLGYSGGLQKWQGVDYIIKALPFVLEKIPNCKLLIIGDGPEREQLEKLSEQLKLKEKILFRGYTPHKEIPLYINSFDISICYLTKLNEGSYGTPFKVYEYLSCGSPTIISDIKGISILFKPSVIIAKPENSTDLAEKIIKLLKNQELRKSLSIQGREFILNGHSWYEVAKKTQEIIEEALIKNKKRAILFHFRNL